MKSIMIFSLLLNFIIFSNPLCANDMPVASEDDAIVVNEPTDDTMYEDEVEEYSDDSIVEENSNEIIDEDEATDDIVEEVEEVTEERITQ